MPVVKQGPYDVAVGKTLDPSAESQYWGVDIAEYIVVGVFFEFDVDPNATGEVYLRVYGCLDSDYANNEKYRIITWKYTQEQREGYIELRPTAMKNLAFKVVNNMNDTITYSIRIIGILLT